MPFTLALQTMKYLGIKLTKYVQDLYELSYKALLYEIKEELNKWGYIPYSCTRKLNIVKISVLPILIQIKCNPN